MKPGGGADEGVLNKCVEELQRLRAEFESHRENTNRNLDHVNNELPHKADKRELSELENISSIFENRMNHGETERYDTLNSKPIRE